MVLYPVNLNIQGRLCVVVGGGPVALRKAESLLEAGARVRIISPEVEAGIQELVAERRLEWFPRDYAEGDVRGAFLVFAATSSSTVQQQISDEAERDRILFNLADDPPGSLFHVPAHFRRGQLVVSIATGGGSPALAKKLRKELEGVIVAPYGAVVELLNLIRESVVAGGNDSAVNGEIFRRLLEKGIVEMTLESNWFALQMLLIEELPERVDGVELLKTFLAAHDQD